MYFRNRNWNVVGWFSTVSRISYAVIAIGLLAMLWHATHAPGGGFQPSHALRLGLSFTGGTDVGVKFKRPVSQTDLKNALGAIGVVPEKITTVSKAGDLGNDRWTIQTQTALGNDTGKLWTALNRVAPVDRLQSSIESVGPSLGREYLTKAIWALVIAISIQFIYIAFRFGWNYIFGLVTVIALVRDAAMMIGIYALFDRRADDAFLAAVLTVIGYSVMDTIVILDRIRENTKLMAGQPYDRIVNTSILQTMTRSINTLATVVITLLALLLLGGGSLQNFAFALLVGIVSGGYHSIFYSAPLVVQLRDRQLAAASRRRRLGLAHAAPDRPRTVAEAKDLASRGGLAREQIIAARKERRVKSKSGLAARNAAPARYRRKRADGTATMLKEQNDDPNYVGEQEIVDPLDAQNAGLHDEAFERGHEEVTLNLEESDAAETQSPHLRE
ncbi:MAG: protein translocase subunit SecF [Candidatus Eremiobacteraeota bacterium]|nr:protein translocase subunit SecF [Candidatus Eremiobacteraeota bacterium]